LRQRVGELCESRGVRLKLVPPALCTDNAAMIAAAALVSAPISYPDYLSFDAFSTDDRPLQPA
jgi:tRNA A37 threonylcarbamoyltransferase TsaD